MAKQLADEWESECRAYAKHHKSGITPLLADLMTRQAVRAGAPITGPWNCRDVANKAVEILKERLGE